MWRTPIPEIIVHGETGILVPLQPKGPTDFEPAHPEAFSWKSIAKQTFDFYAELIARHKAR